jgi:ATP-dependent helicase HrpB
VGERVAEPRGALLREALCILLERGSLFREAVATTRERLARTALAAALAARRSPGASAPEPPAPSAFLRARVEALGVEEPDDLALLSASDFLAPDLPEYERAQLDADYPLELNLGDATYRADYDVTQLQVTLVLLRGTRKEPPPLAYLPRFPGLRICVSSPRGMSVLRAR